MICLVIAAVGIAVSLMSGKWQPSIITIIVVAVPGLLFSSLAAFDSIMSPASMPSSCASVPTMSGVSAPTTRKGWWMRGDQAVVDTVANPAVYD